MSLGTFSFSICFVIYFHILSITTDSQGLTVIIINYLICYSKVIDLMFMWAPQLGSFSWPQTESLTQVLQIHIITTKGHWARILMGQYNSIINDVKTQCELGQKFHLCQWSIGNTWVVIKINNHIISTYKWVVHQIYICKSVV